jgi:bifunctional non-homologous end joining protein LigD
MPRFVIHEHSARNLHWDLRLEMEGVLKSWALPKEPPVERGVRRLAVEVADHARDYITFEGEIEEGYGKGTVKIWDSGSFELESVKPEKTVLEFRGAKIQGRYVLLLAQWSKSLPVGKRQWLFFRASDTPKTKAKPPKRAKKVLGP